MGAEPTLLRHAAKTRNEEEDRAISVAAIWLVVAGVLTLTVSLGRLRHTFTAESHGWAMAHLALMADSFKSHGIIALHGIPIQNAGVDGTDPDFYVHWPPLYSMLLSIVVKVFGDSERVIFATGSVMALAFAASWFWLADELFGRLRALSFTFALLTINVFIDRGHVWTISLCYVLMLLSLKVVLADWQNPQPGKRRFFLAAGALLLATLVSWEALLLAPGLFFSALLVKERKLARNSMILGAVSTFTAAAFLMTALAYVPGLAGELVATIKYRAGVGFSTPVTINTLADAVLYASQPGTMLLLKTLSLEFIQSIGLVDIAAGLLCIPLFWRNRAADLQRKQLIVFTTLAFIAVAWVSVFRNHVFIHDYELLLAAPVAAICTGELLSRLWDHPRDLWRKTLCILLPLILLIHLAAQALGVFAHRNSLEAAQKTTGVREYALEVRSATPPAAVVASPYLGMFVPYYAKRHIVRGVEDDRAVQLLVSHLDAFPNSPVYLDIPEERTRDFPCSMAAFDGTPLKYGVLLHVRANPGHSLTGSGCSTAPQVASTFP